MVRGSLILLLCLASTFALAQQRSVSPNALVISGQVVAAADGTPLRRARVDVVVGSTRVGSVLTDNAGRFSAEATGVGPFVVTVGKGGYAFARTTLSLPEASTPLTVRLPRGAAIFGKVVERHGTPAVNSMVSARRIDPEVPGIPQYFSTSTDDLGTFRLGGLPPGRFEISASEPRSPSGVVITTSGVTQLPVSRLTEPQIVASDRLAGATVLDSQPQGKGPPEERIVGTPEGVAVVLQRPPPPASQRLTLAAGEEASVDFALESDRSSEQALIDKMLSEKLPATPPQPGAAGVIHGRVLTHAGQPVSGAQVRLVFAPGTRAVAFVRGHNATSAADGRYTLTAIRPGSYFVHVTHPGYGTIAFGQQRAHQSGRMVSMAADQTIDGIDVVLPGIGAISGALLDELGDPLQGALVQALQIRDIGGRPAAQPVALPRRTDDRGRYRLSGLLPGRYIVTATVEAMASGANASAGAGVKADARNSSGYAPVFFPGTPAVDAATQIELFGETPAVNFVFTPSRAASVRGVALEAEGPLIGGTARLLVSHRSNAISLDFPPSVIRGDGTFEFGNVPPGDYVVQVRGDGPGRTGMFGYENVSVADADPKPLTIRTTRGATIEGRFVLESGSGDASPGKGVNSALNPTLSAFAVVPIALDPDRARSDCAPGTIAPSCGGNLVVSSEYTFYVSSLFGPTLFRLRQAPSDSWFLKSVTIGGVDITDTGFDPAGLQTVGDAQIVVSEKSATVTGRAIERETPVSDYSVVAFPVFRDQWTPHSRWLRFVTANHDGTFRIGGLPPGDYYVAAVDRLDGTAEAGEWQNADLLGRLVPGAQRVTVREGESRSATLRLMRR